MSFAFRVTELDPWAEVWIGTCPKCNQECRSEDITCPICENQGTIKALCNFKRYTRDENGSYKTQMELKCQRCDYSTLVVHCPHDDTPIASKNLRAKLIPVLEIWAMVLMLPTLLAYLAIIICTFGIALFFNQRIMHFMGLIVWNLTPKWPFWTEFTTFDIRRRYERPTMDTLRQRNKWR